MRGASVTLVDAYGPGNSRSSSGGETRLIRFAYGERTVYTRRAMESYPQWRALEDDSGSPIVLSTGRLVMSSEPGARAEAEAYVNLMESRRVRH